MKRWALMLAALLAASGARGEERREVKIGAHAFSIPADFAIELVAGPPLVDRPIVADFDEEGHLYVADSAGVNDKVEKQLEERPHRIVRLTDVDGDGIYDRSVVFADKMMFPEGLLWHEGAVYCAAPPSIWKLEDTDGDGVADRRSEWFRVGTLTGCANDLHGPYRGPAGWIYWTKGAFARMDLELGDGSRLQSSAAHLFRARPDGSGLESYAAGGMDNPVDITFGERGDVFFSSTFLVHPAQGRRDGLIHAIYGSVYPKQHGVIDDLPRTGELMPALAHLGPAATAGLTTYRSSVFGEEYRGNLFSCLFNMKKVMRHRLTEEGASYRSEDSDFVVSDQVDFHPTDVQEDADGSLLILDTGGWYKLCCPTSVIAKPEVLGAIYRVRPVRGGGAPQDARGKQLDWAQPSPAGLIKLLADGRPVVRDRAIASLARAGQAALPELRSALVQDADQRSALGALWAAARMRTEEGRGVVRSALRSSFPAVQQAGAHACGLERDHASSAGLRELLESPHPEVRREAATALGRLGSAEACEALLACKGGDRFLEHAIIYALIEIGDPTALRGALSRQSGVGGIPANSMRVLWALEGMPEGNLKAEEVLALMASETPVLPILERHPEWGPALAAYYERFLRETTVPGDREGRRDRFLNDFLHWPEVGKVVSDLLLEGTLHEAAYREIGDEAGRPHPLPDTLLPGLEKAVLDGRLPRSGLLRRLRPEQLTARLEEWLQGVATSQDEDGRRWAVEILSRCGRSMPQESFEERLQWVGTAAGWLDAAQTLSQAKLSAEQKLALLEALPRAGAVELESLLKPFEAGGSAELGAGLARALAAAPASRSLAAETVAKLAAAFPETVRDEILRARPADPSLAELATRLAELEKELPPGDRLRGHQVFRSAKAGCVVCHRVAYDGGELGPDLTRIGAIRSRRDLLEAIIAPSASYARGYEPMVVTLANGESRMGTVRREGSRLVVRDLTGREESLEAGEIREVTPSPVSLMPAGLDQNLGKTELADLVTFLESLK